MPHFRTLLPQMPTPNPQDMRLYKVMGMGELKVADEIKVTNQLTLK